MLLTARERIKILEAGHALGTDEAILWNDQHEETPETPVPEWDANLVDEWSALQDAIDPIPDCENEAAQRLADAMREEVSSLFHGAAAAAFAANAGFVDA